MKIPVYILSFIFALSCGSDPITNQRQVEVDNRDSIEVSKSKKSFFSIARIDERSQRVFVIMDTTYLTKIAKIRVIVKHVDSLYSFKDNLNISFFADSRYAGYKDEFEGEGSSLDPAFYENYVGEYSKRDRVFWTYPAFPRQKVKYILD